MIRFINIYVDIFFRGYFIIYFNISGNLTRAIELFEKAIQLTRSEDSMINLCCMLIGSRTQNKILSQLNSSTNGDFANSILMR